LQDGVSNAEFGRLPADGSLEIYRSLTGCGRGVMTTRTRASGRS